MDTGYPALIPEPLNHQNIMKPSTTPSPVEPENLQDAHIQAELTVSPSTNEKTP